MYERRKNVEEVLKKKGRKKKHQMRVEIRGCRGGKTEEGQKIYEKENRLIIVPKHIHSY